MDILNKLALLEKEAADFGFKWEKPQQIIEQILSEISEITIHLNDTNKNKLQEEIGDLIHAVFSLCVFCQLNPLQTLQQSVDKFANRFSKVKQLTFDQGLTSLNGKSFAELMDFWNKAKQNHG